MTPFGVSLRTLREDRGFRQKDLARQLGISAKLLSAIENGLVGARRIGDLTSLAELLSLSDQELLELRRSQQLSSLQLQIPRHATPQKIRVANKVVDLIDVLSQYDFSELESTIDRLAANRLDQPLSVGEV